MLFLKRPHVSELIWDRPVKFLQSAYIYRLSKYVHCMLVSMVNLKTYEKKYTIQQENDDHLN